MKWSISVHVLQKLTVCSGRIFRYYRVFEEGLANELHNAFTVTLGSYSKLAFVWKEEKESQHRVVCLSVIISMYLNIRLSIKCERLALL
jgi:hypothetical protein